MRHTHPEVSAFVLEQPAQEDDTANGGQTQSPLTSFGGGLPWLVCCLLVDNPKANTQDSFNQSPGATPFAVDQLLVSVMTFHADAPGVAHFNWEENPTSSESLNFFGLTNAPGGTVTILGAVPEPTTASLLALGIVGLTLAGRRHQ